MEAKAFHFHNKQTKQKQKKCNDIKSEAKSCNQMFDKINEQIVNEQCMNTEENSDKKKKWTKVDWF